MKHATFRMRTESPGALIDEYTAKVQRLRGEDGKSALALALAQKLGEDQFWRYQQHLAQDAGPGPGGSTPATAAPATARLSPPGATPPSAVAPQPAPAAAHRPGDTAIKAGAYMLGIGVVDFGLGALIVSSTSGGVLFGIALVGGITIGALLAAIGLLTLIIGALIRLGSD
jgi:small-conductance mechanosensitive channel